MKYNIKYIDNFSYKSSFLYGMRELQYYYEQRQNFSLSSARFYLRLSKIRYHLYKDNFNIVSNHKD